MNKKLCALAIFFMAIIVIASPAYAAAAGNVLPIPSVSINVGAAENNAQVSSSIQLMFLVAIISLAPYLIVMLTSFTRIVIVLHFVRNALGTQQMPPNQVLVGLALFLTLFLMSGTITTINDTALKPYSAGIITQQEAIDNGLAPIKEFMSRQAAAKDIQMFANLSGTTGITPENVPMTVLIPAFILGEIAQGFRFGFIIYMPFIVVDMVVASTLMAMGMMMLPPAMISLPFKILLFVVLDGWNLVIEMLVKSFR